MISRASVQAIVFGEQLASVKRIDVSREFAVVEANHEVSRQPDAGDGLAEPPRHFDVHDRQRDRQAQLAIQNFVETAIARIVVVGLVAAESQFAKQVVVGDVEEPRSVGAGPSRFASSEAI